MADQLCRRCALATTKGYGLCQTCLTYQRRNGAPRPSEVIMRHAGRLSDRAVTRSH